MTLIWRPQKFLKSLISTSNTAIDQSLSPNILRADEQVISELVDSLAFLNGYPIVLWKANIRSVNNMASVSDDILLDIHGFGTKALTKLKGRLTSYDLSHNTTRTTAAETEP